MERPLIGGTLRFVLETGEEESFNVLEVTLRKFLAGALERFQDCDYSDGASVDEIPSLHRLHVQHKKRGAQEVKLDNVQIEVLDAMGDTGL
ncbi:hypothetical protein WICPIJ_005082 [Wickerhamomyces pijperi]|uniref:Uncharacterized protein n=1 Tax=Wickerhamomyces pijperi TaxID=599730 RepID=A0A9P8Q6T4_WICPI|nr:hypothetical protein WICPIJ_005082 [Wickerhamomyces pijperi]